MKPPVYPPFHRTMLNSVGKSLFLVGIERGERGNDRHPKGPRPAGARTRGAYCRALGRDGQRPGRQKADQKIEGKMKVEIPEAKCLTS